ncbi:hypothetical protein [Oceanirhabdus sp. W0125-5]|uniref:hypothetical protein n=1 Tax=Oceanirhabdus sp. W0125-5 TaxID=2999116 RepID=UPI0022F31763|nr:hypothetical protein [Oceanirhabdus sp. W0125-5]WBW98833.1 hypothetical protein OW730_08855 [Oceanirhabdus sp. W0125-5]
MATYRVIKDRENPYVMMNKHGIYDSRLSWKAKGLLMYFMSRPDNWEFHEIEIKKHARDGRDGTRAGIKELIEKKYIKRHRERDTKGKFVGWMYEVFEVPFDILSMGEDSQDSAPEDKASEENGKKEEKCKLEKPPLKNPIPEKSKSENTTLIINESNNNDFINKRISVNNNEDIGTEKIRSEGEGNHGDNRNCGEDKRTISGKSEKTATSEDDII